MKNPRMWPKQPKIRSHLKTALRQSTQDALDKLATKGGPSGEKPKKKRGRPEQVFHISVVQTLKLILPPVFVFWHTPNGETGAGKFKGQVLSALGVLAGVHDILILGPDCRLHGLELKAGRGELTDGQKEFGAQLKARGGLWQEARTLVEVQIFIDRLCAFYGLKAKGRVGGT